MAFKYHDCTLSVFQTVNTIIPTNISFRKRIIYKLRSVLIIWENHYRTKFYFKSRYGIVQEKHRQIRKKYIFRIHPLSKLNGFLEIVSSILWIYGIFADSFKGAFLMHMPYDEYYYSHFINRTLNYVLLFLTLIRFFIGYINEKTGEVELDQKKIIKKYLSTYFIFDFVSAFPMNRFVHLLTNKRDEKLRSWLQWLSLLKAMRMNTLFQTMRNYMKYKNLDPKYLATIIICLIITFVTHLLTCITYYMCDEFRIEGIIDKELRNTELRASLQRTYITTYYITILLFYVVEATSHLTNDSEYFISFLIMTLGLIAKLMIFASAITTSSSSNISVSEYEKIVNELIEYANHYRMPLQLKYRLIEFYKNTYENAFFDETMIQMMLSPQLLDDVLLHDCLRCLSNVKLLSMLPEDALFEIYKNSIRELYLINDIIYSHWAKLDSFYFILTGTVAVYLPDGTEYIVHYSDGESLGSIAYVRDGSALVTAYAIEVTQILRFPLKKFEELCISHPDFKSFVITDALSRSKIADVNLGVIRKRRQDIMEEYVNCLEGKKLNPRN